MKRFFTFLVAAFLFSTTMWGQDTIRDVIISEIRFSGWAGCYVEFTNMGGTDVDLSEFIYGEVRSNEVFALEGEEVTFPATITNVDANNKMMRLSGTLLSGESAVALLVYDAYEIGDRPLHPTGMVARSTMFVHQDETYASPLTYVFPYHPEWEMWGKDSINIDRLNCIENRPAQESGVLFWTSGDATGDTITVLVDQIMLDIDWSTGTRKLGRITVAGVENAADNFNFVRKFSIKKGETNWTKAVGADEATSQWILIPQRDGDDYMVRETEGNHGNFSVVVSSDTYTIGEGTISVPWGTEKHDSIRPLLNLGQGMTWWYLENKFFEDSLSTICKTADTLVLYACGNVLEVKKYAITVESAPADMVDVFAKRTVNYPDPDADDYVPGEMPRVGFLPYSVLEYDGVMDSIVDVPFATKVDTMLVRLEKAPDANWEVIFAGGVTNNEITSGDILRVTGGDGSTTKDYYIKTEEYVMSDNALLASITWPDSPYAFIDGWKGDTIPGFINTGKSYTVALLLGTTNVPVLIATTEDLNANISVQRAVSLSGGLEERTTTFTVMSEDDSITNIVKVLFKVENPYIQKYTGHPIFSKFLQRHFYSMGVIELINPTDELIDLSNYMIVRSDATSTGGAIESLFGTDSIDFWRKRYMKYVPGYKWQKADAWESAPGILEFDASVPSYLDPGELFTIWQPNDTYNKWSSNDIMEPIANVTLSDDIYVDGEYLNPWNEPLEQDYSVAFPLFPGDGGSSASNYYLFKILNSDVRDGIKNVYDPADFELVDAFGSSASGFWTVVDGKELIPSKSTRLWRLPHSYYGASYLGELLDTDWDTDNTKNNGVAGGNLDIFGSHTLNVVTAHVSTVSSLVYLVDKGYEPIEGVYPGIKGASNSETVTDFFDNLIKFDEDQDLKVLSAAASDTLELDELVADADTLQVTSANGENITKYLISTVALSGDAVLTAVDGTGIDITVTAPTGTVGGFAFGATIKTVLESVTVPDNAILNIIDENDELVPIQSYNTDTVYVDLIAISDYYFEVIAENGDIIVYQLLPDVASDDAYILSNVYTVYEVPARSVSQVLAGTAVGSFIQNIIPVEGAEIKILTLTGQERTIGNLSIDDIVEVTSEDASVTVSYEITFMGEAAAYVTSTVFTVSQATLNIEAPQGTTVEALLAGLTPAPDATVMVKDVNGDEKTTGELLETDVVVVTSGDGVNTISYSISLIVSVYNDIADQLRVYPNPAESILHVDNVPADTYVRIRDISGRTHSVSQASDIPTGINLAGLSSGMYFLTIEKDRKPLITVKFIKN